MNNITVERFFDYFVNGSIRMVGVRPVIPGNAIQNNAPADELILQALAEDLRRAVHQRAVVAEGLLWNSTESGNRISGYLYINNINNNVQHFHPQQPFRLRNINFESFLALFRIMHQSNDDLTVYDVEWSYYLDDDYLEFGNAITKIPKWVCKILYNHSDI